MAIGDEENDRAMLEAVGSPVVMETARKNSRKSQIHHQIKRRIGVAYAIREWVLK